MSRYAALTAELRKYDEPFVTFTFSELDAIVGGLPPSAHDWGTWWTNSIRSRPHSRFWLDAGRRVSADLYKKVAVFALDGTIEAEEIAEALMDEATPEALTEYVSNSLSLEHDLEDQIVNHLDVLEPGLTLISRQETIEVGRLDLLAQDREGRIVIIELKAGEAKDSAIGQIARYMGWYAHRDGKAPRAMLVAGAFSEQLRYSAKAIPGLRLVTYRVQFKFEDAAI
jgi:hypothetical protein